jgi:Rha family phage regulatory protein
MLENDKPQWTSLDVAEQFDKRHRDVVRAIRNLVEKESNLDAHYRLAFYTATRTSPQPYFNMDRRGYIVLASSFTGKKA